MKTPITVIFFGIQGSGKGTQARLLKKYLDENTEIDTLYLETGQLLREFMSKDGFTNELVKEEISNGELLPSFMPVYVLGSEMVKNFTGAENLIFDGAARRENQVGMIDSMMRMYKRTPYHVIVIDLDEDIATQRLLGRGRGDDSEENIRKRIGWSKEHMKAIIEKFENFDCKIHYIDGAPSIEEIHDSIVEKLHDS